MIHGFRSKKVVVAILLVLGIVSVILGFAGEFTFSGCGPPGPGPGSCVRVYTLDLLAVLAGTIAIGVGIKFTRELSGSH